MKSTLFRVKKRRAPKTSVDHEAEKYKAQCIDIMRRHPRLSVPRVQEVIEKEGIESPSLTTLYRWRELAGIPLTRKTKKGENIRAILYPTSHPNHLMLIEGGALVRRSDRLEQGGFIFEIIDQVEGNTLWVCTSFLDFLARYEKQAEKPVQLYIETDTGLRLVEDEPEQKQNQAA